MKKFNKCLFCGKTIPTFPSRRSKFCNRLHYFLFIETAKNNEIRRNSITDEKKALLRAS